MQMENGFQFRFVSLDLIGRSMFLSAFAITPHAFVERHVTLD